VRCMRETVCATLGQHMPRHVLMCSTVWRSYDDMVCRVWAWPCACRVRPWGLGCCECLPYPALWARRGEARGDGIPT